MTHLSTGNTPETFYPVQDHINTTWALLKGDGTFKEKYAYDPCSHFVERCMAVFATKCNPDKGAAKQDFRQESKRVNPDNWQLDDTRVNPFVTDRGFTGHVPCCSKSTSVTQFFWQTVAMPIKSKRSKTFVGKHYDWMNLINMNARMYDPRYEEFLNVDPQTENYPGWSSYVYCMNNPLKYIDATGESTFDKDGIMINDDGGNKTNYYNDGNDTYELPSKEILQGAREVLNAANSKKAGSDLGPRTREFGMNFDAAGNNASGLVRGNNPEIEGNDWSAKMSFERNWEGKGKASIHAHSTDTVDIPNENYDPFNDTGGSRSSFNVSGEVNTTSRYFTIGKTAKRPSAEDAETFKHYEINIIVGNDNEYGNGSAGHQGAAFFGSEVTTESDPRYWIEDEILDKILKQMGD